MRKITIGLVALGFAAALTAPNAALAFGKEDENARKMQEKMQERMSGKLGGLNTNVQIGAKLDTDLSERVDAKNSEMEKKIEEQSTVLTSADRGNQDASSDQDDSADRKPAEATAAQQDAAVEASGDDEGAVNASGTMH